MNEVISPMPGKIVKILVKTGDLVKEESQVMIHEAMKMENSIFSGYVGTVKEIRVNEGDSVDTSQVLLLVG